MQRALAVVAAPDRGRDVYANTKPLWQPVWGRGIFGGALIAQALIVAQETVSSKFVVHSIHSHFILAANPELPVSYHVDRTRDGKAMVTRIVHAEQNGKSIFTATLSFVLFESLSNTASRRSLRHQAPVPPDARRLQPPTAKWQPVSQELVTETCQPTDKSLFECVRVPLREQHQPPERQKLRQWSRTTHRIGCDEGSGPASRHNPHLAALAFLTDNYFIGTVARAHRANRFSTWSTSRTRSNRSLAPAAAAAAAADADGLVGLVPPALLAVAREEARENMRPGAGRRQQQLRDREELAMMVTLSHTIFFHNQTSVEADDWMLWEMETPWAGDERGLVLQKVWNRGGTLLATCVQEGLVRLKQDEAPPRSRI